MKYSYIIFDSDTIAVSTIQNTIEDHVNYVCVGVATNQKEAIDLVLETKPKIIFLAPESEGVNDLGTGYNLLLELGKYMSQLPEVIVISNSTDFAIEGIRNSVLDYLVKPLQKNEIIKSLYRFEKDKNKESESTLCFKSYGDYRFVDMEEVLYLKAENNTTDFIMNNGNKVEAFKTLKHFQQVLPDNFVRIHNSYIINTKYVSRIHFGKAKCSIKNTTDLIPFSRSYKNNVEEIKNTLAMNSLLDL